MYKKKVKPLTTLTPPQKRKLATNKKHHTKKHMDMMKKEMISGSTFMAAHKKAKRIVGK